MKKIFTLLFLACITTGAMSQNVDYSLRYDDANCRFEALAIANVNIKPTQSGASSYTIILPGNTDNNAITSVTSHSPSASGWSLTNTAFTASADYYQVELNSKAAYGKVNAGDTIVLFYFEMGSNECVDVRAWNSTDATDPLSNGDDFSNVFVMNKKDEYGGNYMASVDLVDPVITQLLPNCIGGVTHGIDAEATITNSTSSCGTSGYSWTGPNGFTATTLDITVADAVTSIGEYTLTVTDAFGCETSGSLTLDSSNCFTAPVPVTLMSFEGFRRGEENTLLWTTASEINNSHFEIQRKVGSSDFETIGIVHSLAGKR